MVFQLHMEIWNKSNMRDLQTLQDKLKTMICEALAPLKYRPINHSSMNLVKSIVTETYFNFYLNELTIDEIDAYQIIHPRLMESYTEINGAEIFINITHQKKRENHE